MSTKRRDNPYEYKRQQAIKRRRVNKNMRALGLKSAPRTFVQRTPGGQIVADNHYFDTEMSNTAIANATSSWSTTELDANTTAMLCLFAPVIGDDIQNRSGRKVFVKKMRISGVIRQTAGTAGAVGETPTPIRIIVYQDKQTNGTQSQGEDVMGSGGATLAMNMFANINNFGRFRILKDKTLVCGKALPQAGLTGAFVSSGDMIPFKFNIKVNQWVNYNSTNGGTVADVIDNSFHLIATAHNNTSLAPTMEYKVRTVFTP